MIEKSILLVEDEDNIALALAYLIGKQGYRLARVSDGAEAIDRIEAERPDLVVLDVMLPGRSGYDICQTIRARPTICHTKILMMTARGGEVERRKGLALGADAFLSKPFASADLTARIAALLGDGADG
ncbi:response regulator transcription factor [Lacimonas salitolerans]|uniref:Response regulator transcription factor n=1 Tax=Lacimonas salitolerans TaxID=1323750 RepID=A0ABW4ENU6_9RHOB